MIFTEEFQRRLLALVVRADFMRRTAGVVRAEMFSSEPGQQTPRSVIADVALSWAQEFPQDRLTVETMDELLRQRLVSLKPHFREAVEAEWRQIRTLVVPDARYIETRATRWARETTFAQAVASAAQLLGEAQRNGLEPDLNRALREIMAAAGIGRAGEGGRLWIADEEDVSYWSQLYHERRRVPTLLGELDRAMDGGPAKGEFHALLAPPKAGKTSLLGSFAVGASMRHFGVAWFSFEMRLMAMLARLDRRLARQGPKEITQDITPLLRARAGMRASQAGPVWVEALPPMKHGVDAIRKRVDALRADGIAVDVVIADYLNLMTSSMREREKRHEIAAVARELSALAKELDVVVWTAALTNRAAVNRVRIQRTHVAESYEMIAVVDGAIAIGSTEEMRAARLRNLWITSLREEGDERLAGTYEVDLAKMYWKPADPTLAEMYAKEHEAEATNELE